MIAHTDVNNLSFPVLSAMIILPLVGAAIVALLPKTQAWTARAFGLVVTAGVFGLGTWLVFAFNSGESGYQAIENHIWIKDL